MEDFQNEKFLTIKEDTSCARPQYWSKSFVSHANVKISEPLVGDESRIIRKHVVSRVSVHNNERSGRRINGNSVRKIGRENRGDGRRKDNVGRK